ncbi:MAG: GH3 auxin-responsive promoter family protein, partial [Dysgonamonadaceae bacterium]|nr:GH3 auxin-responsive promoter family protein [Dysgonamonadaceae bacterium]
PGRITWFAKSSGTTSDKSKFIPVSRASLSQCHYRGGMDCAASYLNNFPDSKVAHGKGLVLGGSHKSVADHRGIQTGDLSAILIQNMNPVANLFRTPGKNIILKDEWEAKLEEICEKTYNQRVTNLSGVPSWMLVLIKKMLQKTGKSNLTEVWPHLEVFFHGGVSFAPYAQQYKELIPSEKMRYMETYNASEGFFSLQNDMADPSMLLLLDYGIFYEFIPMEDIDSENPRIIPLADVELNKNYAIVISSCNGLWRYKIGDTVLFTSIRPYKIQITGRTRHYINVFGEELMVGNADLAIQKASELTGAQVLEYTAAPVYMSSHSKGRHQWLIEFKEQPASIEAFTNALDAQLQSLNSDYEAKRYKNITLDKPEIIVAREGVFHDWLKEKGQLGGQHKVPRLSNSRTIIEEILQLLS